ncbi:VOC family protein [Flaviaesturariibacter flavus]|uniref:VOC family protein n=1 Tax=Flaviaesturariibacter flavus TaxID=2502780 RepID=A0A4R1B991_9BACT|nr:VOC family protein [Flaviaesturariibacter flavus]TCJ13373.1 VOC family protein [Flaviaesturariibacter flavus]
MQTHAIPYLNFNGQAREALEFYKNCFGGELQLLEVGASPMAERFPAEAHGRIMHGQLNNGAFVLMASDMFPGPYATGNNFSVMVACATEEECRRFFEKISEGGNVFDSLKIQFWGALFGVVTDRFGVRWNIGWDPKSAN